MALFSPPPAQTPNFGGGQSSSPLLNQALSLFSQVRAQRFQEKRDERAEERYRQQALQADERAERRLLMSDELQQQRQIEAEDRAKAHKSAIAEAQLEAYRVLSGGVAVAMSAPNLSPIQESKVPYPELEGLTEDEVTDLLLRNPLLKEASTAGAGEAASKPTLNAGGKVLLKQLMGDKPIRHWSEEHEGQLMDRVLQQAQENLADLPPEAVMGAVEQVVEEMERTRARYRPLEEARMMKLEKVRDALEGYGPRPQIGGSPQDFGIFRVSDPRGTRAEAQDLPAAVERLGSGAAPPQLGAGHLAGLFPEFAKANPAIEGTLAAGQNRFTLVPFMGQDGGVAGFRVQHDGPREEQAIAQELEKEINRTAQNVARTIGWVGKGAALDFANLEDFGTPMLSSEAGKLPPIKVKDDGPAPEGARPAAPQKRDANSRIREMLRTPGGG